MKTAFYHKVTQITGSGTIETLKNLSKQKKPTENQRAEKLFTDFCANTGVRLMRPGTAYGHTATAPETTGILRKSEFGRGAQTNTESGERMSVRFSSECTCLKHGLLQLANWSKGQGIEENLFAFQEYPTYRLPERIKFFQPFRSKLPEGERHKLKLPSLG